MLVEALLHDFLSDGEKSYNDIVVYLERARSHPTGKMWVDTIIIKPHISCYGVGSSRKGDRLATAAGLPVENAASSIRSWPPLVCQVYHCISSRDAKSPCSS